MVNAMLPILKYPSIFENRPGMRFGYLGVVYFLYGIFFGILWCYFCKV